ncbi:MAG: hypothetical protein QG670_2752, partial [Thermoproteota archaeon]|nr:hypothetical protein [Thermoproteota archaeon]
EEIKEVKRDARAAKAVEERPGKQERANADNERRLVLLAIENISSTKTARLQGIGASSKLIKEYTKLPDSAVNTSLAWLKSKGIIYTLPRSGWHIKETPRDNFCFKHGYVEFIAGRCLQCLNKSGR